MKKYTLLAIITSMLLGCSSDDVEFAKTDTYCKTVENSKIEVGGTGLRDVVRADDGNQTAIGYMNNGRLVNHSECTAARIELSGANKVYRWYEFGRAINHDGVHSIEFYTNADGQASSIAEQIPRAGTWQQQVVENAAITRQVWLNELPFNSITADNNYDNNNIREVVAISGTIQKTKRYNTNTAQFDCIWSDDGAITSDVGCTAEHANDLAILGISFDSDYYLSQLDSATISYEIDPDELDKDIHRYF